MSMENVTVKKCSYHIIYIIKMEISLKEADVRTINNVLNLKFDDKSS